MLDAVAGAGIVAPASALLARAPGWEPSTSRQVPGRAALRRPPEAEGRQRTRSSKGTLVATLLYRLGALAARRRLTFLGSALVALTALLVTGFGFAGSFAPSDSIPGSAAQVALTKLDAHFPDSGDGPSGEVVLVAPAGEQLTEGVPAEDLRTTYEQLGLVDGVTAVSDPAETLSEDGRTAVAQVTFEGVEDADVPVGTLDAVRDVGSSFSDGGGRVLYGGDAFEDSEPPIGPMEGIGVAVALLVLLVTFGSIVAAGIPLITAILGVASTVGGVLLAANVFGIADNALTLSVMLGLAVGIDYALLILSRHRRQLAQGMSVDESVARATASAGSAVVFAGLTVIIALAGLAVAGVPMLTSMGMASAGAVAMAVLFSLLVLPAAMALIGERLRPAPGSRAALREVEADGRAGLGVRWVTAVTRHPRKVIAGTVLLLATLAVPAASLQLALTDAGTDPTSSESRHVYDELASAFGPGANGPLAVLVEGGSETEVRESGRIAAAEVAELNGVESVGDVQVAPDGLAGVIQVLPSSGPRDPATSTLVADMRSAVAPVADETGSYVEVTGQTAVSIDVADRLSAALLPFTLVVVGLSLLLLMVAFRSWTIPLKATIGFLLSVGAAFGAVVAVFQWGWLADLLGVAGTGPVASFVPIIVMAVLFGLAMDYEVFLVSSMREHYARNRNAHEAIWAGSRNAGRVVVSAALIMISVFASFMLSPDSDIKQIAFALGFGVAVDAFVVRLTLVPAVLALLGDRAWSLPGWLDRLVPTVDVEGHDLPEALPEAMPDALPRPVPA